MKLCKLMAGLSVPTCAQQPLGRRQSCSNNYSSGCCFSYLSYSLKPPDKKFSFPSVTVELCVTVGLQVQPI